MKRIIWLTLILVAAPAFVRADDTATVRPEKEITLALPKGEKKTIHLGEAPYIGGGVITLFPGDKILVEFEIVNGVPKNPTVVPKNVHPERTLELEMNQGPDISSISRTSGFTQKLDMKCYFLLVGSDFENNANMAPLEKGLNCFDAFEPKAYCVKLYDFGFER